MVRVEDIIEKLKVLFSANDYENAEKLLISARKVSELYNDVVAIYDANLSLLKGDYPQMWETIRRGLESNPLNYELYVLLGEYYLNANPNQAYLCFENALYYCDNEADREQIVKLIDELKREKEITVKNVSFVILSYNTLEFTKVCIESIRENTMESTREIVIVDNASTDGSLEWLQEQKDIVLRANKENSGFPKGCNQGVEVAAKENDIFLLNNDTLVPPNALFWLRMGLYENDSVGATGSITNFASNLQAIPFEDASTENMLRYAIANNVLQKYPYEEKLHLVGFALLIKRSVWDEIGELDEIFSPGNYEDNDYGIRVVKAGYKNILCKNSFILHFGSKSFGKKAEAYAKLLATNRQKFIEKWKLAPNYYFEPRADLVNMIREEIEADICVLDIGCACGATCAYIKGRFPNSTVYGIEKVPEVAEVAKGFTEVLCADAETIEFPWEEKSFDYIILGDVLGYLREPKVFLKKIKQYIADEGHIIASVSNAMFYPVILSLIMNDDVPADKEALLDTTNVKRYTGKEIIRLIQEGGYVIEDALPLLSSSSNEQINAIIDNIMVATGVEEKNVFFTNQYVIKARSK